MSFFHTEIINYAIALTSCGVIFTSEIGAIPLRSKKWSEAISDALCNLCLSPFNFTIIFHDDKYDENKVLGNARIHVNSPL